MRPRADRSSTRLERVLLCTPERSSALLRIPTESPGLLRHRCLPMGEVADPASVRAACVGNQTLPLSAYVAGSKVGTPQKPQQ
eukprot:1144002-Pelagomonas_calceolata.AAC.3